MRTQVFYIASYFVISLIYVFIVTIHARIVAKEEIMSVTYKYTYEMTNRKGENRPPKLSSKKINTN